MVAESWGPSAWYFLHKIAFNYDKNKKNRYIKFINIFADFIPCPYCEHHFRKMLNESDFNKIMQNRDTFFSWTILIHNKVNNNNNKKIFSYNDALKIYNKNNVNKELITIFLNEFYKSNNYRGESLKNFLILFCDLFPNENVKRNLLGFYKRFDPKKIDNYKLYNIILNIINISIK